MSKPHGRLTQPLVREGADLRPASWDEALDVVATGFARVVLDTNNVDSCNRT